MNKNKSKALFAMIVLLGVAMVAKLNVQAFGTPFLTSNFTTNTAAPNTVNPGNGTAVAATTEAIPTTEQPVTLDKTLHKALKEGETSSKKIVIDDFSGEIKSLKELEKYPKLEKLTIYGDGTYQHNAENEAILNSLKNLKKLEIYCKVKGTGVTLALPKLEKLAIGYNNVIKSSFDKLDVSKCKQLQVVGCIGNKKLNKIILPEKGKVRTVICRWTGVSQLVNLSKQKKLQGLSCSYSNISKLNLKPFTKLHQVDCQYTKVTSLNLKNSKIHAVMISPIITKKISYPTNLYKYFYMDLLEKKPYTVKLKNYMPQGYRYYETTDAIGKRVAQACMKYRAASHTLRIAGEKNRSGKDLDMSFKKGSKFFIIGTGGRANSIDYEEAYLQF